MEVILLEKVANLGNLGDKVNIRAVTPVTSCCRRARPPSPPPRTSLRSKHAAPSWKRLPPRRRPLPKPVLPSSPSWW